MFGGEMGKIRHLLPTVLQSHRGINSEKKYGRQKKAFIYLANIIFHLPCTTRCVVASRAIKLNIKNSLP